MLVIFSRVGVIENNGKTVKLRGHVVKANSRAAYGKPYAALKSTA